MALPQKSSGPVKVVPIQAIELDTVDFDEFIGRTEASETVEVRARVSGFIKSVEFEDGSTIAENQLLYKIEPDQYQAIYRQARSQIDLLSARSELAESKLVRAQKLIEAKAISQEEYEENVAAMKESQAAIVAAEADAGIAELDLKYTEVRAPIAGRIDRTLITPGNMVTGGLTQGTLLTRIVRNSPMFVYFDVDERSLLTYQRLLAERRQSSNETQASLKERKVPCFLQLQDENDFSHQGLLDFIENRADSDTGTIRVRGTFTNQDGLLTGGLFVRLRIPSTKGKYKAVLIPEMAIVSDQTAKSVFVIGSDKKVERRSIELGAQKSNLRVVTKGLQAGELIVLDGIQQMRDGATVEFTDSWKQRADSLYEKAKTEIQIPELSTIETAIPAEGSTAPAKASEANQPSATNSSDSGSK
jgi:RND family efflux transporter MFP subunit